MYIYIDLLKSGWECMERPPVLERHFNPQKGHSQGGKLILCLWECGGLL